MSTKCVVSRAIYKYDITGYRKINNVEVKVRISFVRSFLFNPLLGGLQETALF